jgi:multiple sugar transport system substrate-binding protein
VATAQRFEELHPEISIQWEKRSLQDFADASMAELAARFDLIVMDHPHTALAATEGLLLPYEDWLSAEFLSDQAAHSVGASHESYRFREKQWTLATDAATPVATWQICLRSLITTHWSPVQWMMWSSWQGSSPSATKAQQRWPPMSSR